MVTRNSFVMLIYLLPKTEILREGAKVFQEVPCGFREDGGGHLPCPNSVGESQHENRNRHLPSSYRLIR